MTVAGLLDSVFIAERAAHYVAIRGVIFGILNWRSSSCLSYSEFTPRRLILAWVLSSLLTSAGTLIWQVKRFRRTHRYGIRGVVPYIRKWFKISCFIT